MSLVNKDGIMRTAAIGSAIWVLVLGVQWAWTQGPANSAANEAPIFATRQRVFAIPFTVDQRAAQPIEVHLYVSQDSGSSWQLYARQQPSARQFTFRASRDGEFWFASRTLDAGRPAPADSDLRPELRVAVDTVQPNLQFTARPGADGRVLSSWQATDPNLDPASLRIEYQESLGKPWKPVSLQHQSDGVVRSATQGQQAWFPAAESPTINIRATISDRAGNQMVVNRRLLLPNLATRPNRSGDPAANLPRDPFARQRVPSEGAVPWPSDNQRPKSPAPNRFATQHDPQNRGNSYGSEISQRPGTVSSGPEMRRSPNMSTMPAHLPANSDPSEMTRLPTGTGHTPALAVADRRDLPGTLPLDSDVDSVHPALDPSLSGPTKADDVPVEDWTPSAGPQSQFELPPGERARMTDASRFRLDYSVEAIGASGVAEVQLWASGDGGQTWRLWGVDDDLQSPFDVEVEEEGVFGFRVVIVGRNGLAGRPPQAGDPADIWVGIDTTKPRAELLSATYGKGALAGKMILRWQATDEFIGERPVSLFYSETAGGPWQTIVSSLPNTGEYAWPADPQLPSSVYLRLEVQDEAGNVAVHELSDSVRLDGLAPKARINGVLPVPKLDREAFRPPRRKW